MTRFLACCTCLVALQIGTIGATSQSAAAETFSTPPLVDLPQPSKRPMGDGPAKFVDAERGDDAADGSEAKPWRTIVHALAELAPGDTLYLRGGTYYENVRVSVVGRADAPITLRSYPGELATIDGGLPEFFRNPADSWEPIDGTDGEYRSARRYGNLRYVLGSFGDSFVGLNTYYHRQDLVAAGEAWVTKEQAANSKGQKVEVEPVYCGPGLWYDAATGRIHARLAHTHLTNSPNYTGTSNYTGPTDPRRVPLVVATSAAIPLRLDGAKHVRVQDLVIRGGGHDTVLLEQTEDVVLDNLTIWCAANGVRGTGARGLKLLHSGIYGNVPPWTFRNDTSLRARPGSGARDITRLNTHALLVPSANRESDVYAFPQNDDWEIAYCTFAVGHDGVYLGGLNLKFHHNLIHKTQDDGIYLSPMYASYSDKPFEIHLYQNVIRDCLTALAFGGPESRNTDRVFIYRNVLDLTALVPTGRPANIDESPRTTPGNPMGDHGSPPWSTMYIYHNTIHTLEPGRAADHALSGAATADRPRFLMNNLFTAGYRASDASGKPRRFPPVTAPAADCGRSDGNLYWIVGVDAAQGLAALEKFRKSEAFAVSQKAYPAGFTSHSLVADPQLGDDDVPRGSSPAVDAGVPIPAEWPDPLRGDDTGPPDIGAFPAGAKPQPVGRGVN